MPPANMSVVCLSPNPKQSTRSLDACSVGFLLLLLLLEGPQTRYLHTASVPRRFLPLPLVAVGQAGLLQGALASASQREGRFLLHVCPRQCLAPSAPLWVAGMWAHGLASLAQGFRAPR